MTYLVGTLLIIFFVFALQGLISFLPWFIGYVYGLAFFPVEVINQIIYPVGSFVYWVYTGLAFFLLARVILNFYHKHS